MLVYRTLRAALVGAALAAAPAIAEIPEIDSSGWATAPRAFGMSAKEYIQAESRASSPTSSDVRA